MESSHLMAVLLCGISGALGAWFFSRWGVKFSLLDESNHRSSHEGVVPKGGGVGILAGFILACWLLDFPAAMWVSSGVISILSLLGDRREISPRTRLFVQFLAGLLFLVGLFVWQGRGWIVYALLPVFAVYVVGTANYYNFMDGINGIAGITGMVGFGLLSFSSVTATVPNGSMIMLAICMAFACLGFLPFNMPKANVFMGDVGSILLGFLFAGLVVGLAKSMTDFLTLCGLLFPFYADELFTTYTRLRNGEHLMKPHRKHVYQLLANELGYAHWKVSIGYGILQGVIGMSLLIARQHGLLVVLGLLLGYFVAFAVVGQRVRQLSGMVVRD